MRPLRNRTHRWILARILWDAEYQARAPWMSPFWNKGHEKSIKRRSIFHLQAHPLATFRGDWESLHKPTWQKHGVSLPTASTERCFLTLEHIFPHLCLRYVFSFFYLIVHLPASLSEMCISYLYCEFLHSGERAQRCGLCFLHSGEDHVLSGTYIYFSVTLSVFLFPPFIFQVILFHLTLCILLKFFLREKAVYLKNPNKFCFPTKSNCLGSTVPWEIRRWAHLPC